MLLIFALEKCPTKSHCLFTPKLNVEILNAKKYVLIVGSALTLDTPHP